MPEFMNHWHDWVRLLVLVLCLYNLYVLVRYFWKKADTWNTKTKDLWYALLMWTVAGAIIGFEGIRKNADLDFRLPFVTAAVLVSLKGLKKKGTWGGCDD